MRMRRFVGLSSTSKTGMPRNASTLTGMATSSRAGTTNGTRTQKLLPLPTSLSTQIVPPISSTSCLQIASPRPEPPCLRVVEPSACSKRSKTRGWVSGAMPMPVSCTANLTQQLSASTCSTSALATTSPSSVNLTALPSRFTKIWRSR